MKEKEKERFYSYFNPKRINLIANEKLKDLNCKFQQFKINESGLREIDNLETSKVVLKIIIELNKFIDKGSVTKKIYNEMYSITLKSITNV